MQIIFSSVRNKAKNLAVNCRLPDGLLKKEQRFLNSVINKSKEMYSEILFVGQVNKAKLAILLDFISRLVCKDITFTECIRSEYSEKLTYLLKNAIYICSFVENKEHNTDKLRLLSVLLLIREVIILLKTSDVHFSSIEIIV